MRELCTVIERHAEIIGIFSVVRFLWN